MRSFMNDPGTGRGRTNDQGPRPKHPSCERLLAVVEALADFLRRCSLAAVLVLDVRGDGPAFLFQQLQHLADGRVALTPRHVITLMLLSIFDMQVRDACMVLADERHGVVVGGGE